MVEKASAAVRVGNVLTFPLGPHIRVIEIVALGVRRGPAAEARTLYRDLSPPEPGADRRADDQGRREPGAGRPTKADRRAIERLKSEE